MNLEIVELIQLGNVWRVIVDINKRKNIFVRIYKIFYVMYNLRLDQVFFVFVIFIKIYIKILIICVIYNILVFYIILGSMKYQWNKFFEMFL